MAVHSRELTEAAAHMAPVEAVDRCKRGNPRDGTGTRRACTASRPASPSSPAPPQLEDDGGMRLLVLVLFALAGSMLLVAWHRLGRPRGPRL